MFDLRCVAHALHATSDHNALVARLDALSSKHDGLEAARADLVDSRSIRTRGHARAERDLTSRRLAHTRLDDITEVDFFDNLGVDTGLLERMLERNNTQLGSGDSLQRAVNRPDGSAGRSDDDSFVTDGRGLSRR